MNGPVVMDARALQGGFKAHKERGIGRYARNLIAAMLELEGPEALRFLTQKGLERPALPGDHLRAAYIGPWLPIGKRIISHHWLVRRPLAPAWRGGGVVHFLCHLDAPATVGPRTVITVHDLIAQRMQALYQEKKSGARFRLERWLETRCLFGAACLIAVSQCTADDVSELYGIDPARITVIPEAADPGLAPVEDPAELQRVRDAYGLERDFFFYLGGIDQRKDMGTLLAALAALQGPDAPLLALGGSIEGDKQHPNLLKEIERLGLGERVRLLGFVPEADLAPLFGACLAFVFPSLYEGFGLPPLEAMACGAPVVAARAGSVPEVVGQAGLLVPPGDAGQLAEAMRGLAGFPEMGIKLRQSGLARAAEFSWQRAARETLAVYREVAGEA